LKIGDGCCEQGLQAGLPPASVAGFTHPEVLEMVDLAFYLGPPAQQRLGGGLALGGPGRFYALMVAADHDGAPAAAVGAAVP
jgi:hypothetical protein